MFVLVFRDFMRERGGWGRPAQRTGSQGNGLGGIVDHFPASCRKNLHRDAADGEDRLRPRYSRIRVDVPKRTPVKWLFP
jgi:hypothetical protein